MLEGYLLLVFSSTDREGKRDLGRRSFLVPFFLFWVAVVFSLLDIHLQVLAPDALTLAPAPALKTGGGEGSTSKP